MNYFFTSESVSEGHPDKIADQISDAILDHFIAYDKDSKVACETLVTTGQVILAGEIKSDVYIDVQEVAREVIRNIGYTKSAYKFDADSCGILSALHEQSADINQGVDRGEKEKQGAGDQGMMFGYACDETAHYMPLPLDMSHALLKELAAIRKERKYMTYLRPDAKSQVTFEYDANTNKPQRVHTIVISTQHDPECEGIKDQALQDKIKEDIKNILIPQMLKNYPEYEQYFDDNIIYQINPTGKFEIGGPHGDSGLTGRKIIVDTYGGKGAHGGGAFSGKDPSKVDRSAAYAMRHIAKNMVAAGLCSEVLIQVAYAIGVVEPMGVYINTYGTSKVGMSDAEIAVKIQEIFDLTPAGIEERLKLRNPIYLESAAYGHMGREPKVVKKTFKNAYKGDKEVEVELFTWEKLDYVDRIKEAFNL